MAYVARQDIAISGTLYEYGSTGDLGVDRFEVTCTALYAKVI